MDAGIGGRGMGGGGGNMRGAGFRKGERRRTRAKEITFVLITTDLSVQSFSFF